MLAHVADLAEHDSGQLALPAEAAVMLAARDA